MDHALLTLLSFDPIIFFAVLDKFSIEDLNLEYQKPYGRIVGSTDLA
jgi:hypothetical protein